MLLVSLLLGSILIQPVTQAFAEAPEEPVEALPVADDVRQQEEQPVAPEEQTPEQVAPDVPQEEPTNLDNQNPDATDEEQPPAAEGDGASEPPSVTTVRMNQRAMMEQARQLILTRNLRTMKL